MIPTLSPRALRRLSTLALALLVATATGSLVLEGLAPVAATLGVRASAAPLSGVLAHAGARGDVRTAALGRGAMGAPVVSAHPVQSSRTVAGVHARRQSHLPAGEPSAVRAPTRRARPVDAAPQPSRASSAAAPRAPPRA